MRAEAFWARVDKSGDCWLWMGARKPSGYGTVAVGGTTTTAHRWAYLLNGGVIPEGYQLDHLCGNPPCVRPSHMEPVPGAVNNGRSSSPPAVNARKTECLRGHPLSGDNLRIDAAGKRQCRACRRERQRRSRARLASIHVGPGTGSVNRSKTHCPQGHPYDAANTWTDRRGHRYCRECMRIANRRRRATSAQGKQA